MPYSKCPFCGNVAHLNVIDPEAWYRERYPDLPFMSLVAGPCFHCFYDLSVGDDVIVRKHFSDHASWAAIGCRGTITRITTCEHGSIYHVDIHGGKDESFVRGELKRPRETKGDAD